MAYTDALTRVGVGGPYQQYEFAQDVNVAVGTVALTLTAFSPTVTVTGNVNVAAETAALTLTTQPATISYDVTVAANTAALTLATLSATVSYDVEVQANTAALTLQTYPVTITADAEVSTGGHFIPGLAGIRAGKRRKPREALEAAAEVVEEIVEDVLEDSEPEKPTVQRVSRKRKSAIIDRAAEEFARQGVFIGDVTALERAATRIAKVAIKRRRAHLSALQDQKKARIQAESRAVLLADEDEVIAAAVLLLLRDDT